LRDSVCFFIVFLVILLLECAHCCVFRYPLPSEPISSYIQLVTTSHICVEVTLNTNQKSLTVCLCLCVCLLSSDREATIWDLSHLLVAVIV